MRLPLDSRAQRDQTCFPRGKCREDVCVEWQRELHIVLKSSKHEWCVLFQLTAHTSTKPQKSKHLCLERGCSSTCCWMKIPRHNCWTMEMFQQAEVPFVAHGMALARFSLHPHGLLEGTVLLNAETAVSGLLLLKCMGQSWGWNFQPGRSCLQMFNVVQHPFPSHSFLHYWSSPLKHPEFVPGWQTSLKLYCVLMHFASFSALFSKSFR